MKILILQDDINRVRIFNERLKDHQVFITDNADVAIQKLNQDIFDYCFLDHDLGNLQMQWDENNCGMKVVDHMVTIPQRLRHTRICIHSYNAPRARIMLDKLTQCGLIAQYTPGAWLIIS